MLTDGIRCWRTLRLVRQQKRLEVDFEIGPKTGCHKIGDLLVLIGRWITVIQLSSGNEDTMNQKQTTKQSRIVILGAGYAGMIAAMRLAKKTHHAAITLVNASPDFVERIRLHQLAAN